MVCVYLYLCVCWGAGGCCLDSVFVYMLVLVYGLCVWMSDCLIRQHAVISFHWPQSKNTHLLQKHTYTHIAGWNRSTLTHTYTHTHTVHTDAHTQTSSGRWRYTEWREEGIAWLAETVEQVTTPVSAKIKTTPKNPLHIPEFKLYTELHRKPNYSENTNPHPALSLDRFPFIEWLFTSQKSEWYPGCSLFLYDMQAGFTNTKKQLHDNKKSTVHFPLKTPFKPHIFPF